MCIPCGRMNCTICFVKVACSSIECSLIVIVTQSVVKWQKHQGLKNSWRVENSISLTVPPRDFPIPMSLVGIPSKKIIPPGHRCSHRNWPQARCKYHSPVKAFTKHCKFTSTLKQTIRGWQIKHDYYDWGRKHKEEKILDDMRMTHGWQVDGWIGGNEHGWLKRRRLLCRSNKISSPA